MFVRMKITHSTNNKMNYKTVIVTLALLITQFGSYQVYSQQMDSIEVYMIESYVAPKIPYNFFLSYFTSNVCKSKILFNGYQYHDSC